MFASAFLAGFGLGFLGSVPIAGPISLVVVDTTLDDHPRKGLDIAMGAAIAESIYAAVAFWGLTRLFAQYPMFLPLSRLLGGAVLFVVGLYFTFRRVRHEKKSKPEPLHDRRRNLLLGFTIALFNPALIATWAAAIAATHAFLPSNYSVSDTLPFAIGACLGIVSWFWLLIRIVCRAKNHLRVRLLDVAVKLMGVALFISGAYISIHALLRIH